MALNFQLFDPTYQTSNFYSAIAKIEKGWFKDGIYEVFEWARNYALFWTKENIETLKLFFQKDNKYQLLWETELEKWVVLIVWNDDMPLLFLTLLEQAKVSQEVKWIL